MAIVINGSGTITGVSAGGLPTGSVTADTLATNSVDSAELVNGAIDSGHLASGVGGASTQIKEIYTTFDLSSSTGTFAVTGVGFEPEFIYVMAGEHESLAFSWGFGTVGGASKLCSVNWRKADASAKSGVTTEIAYYWPNGSHRHMIDIDSMDSDGATFGNTKIGSPTGTFTMYMYFMRFSA